MEKFHSHTELYGSGLDPVEQARYMLRNRWPVCEITPLEVCKAFLSLNRQDKVEEALDKAWELNGERRGGC